MQIVGLEAIDAALKKESNWKPSLDRWDKIVSEAAWKDFSDVRKTFGNASRVGGKVVFNISGNKARLISLINYELRIVIVEQVLSHNDYDKGQWRKK